jgi:hypothetical protein
MLGLASPPIQKHLRHIESQFSTVQQAITITLMKKTFEKLKIKLKKILSLLQKKTLLD